MPWRCFPGDDSTVEVIVEPDFHGDLSALASRRPVRIVDTVGNGPGIDATRAGGQNKNLFEVSRCFIEDETVFPLRQWSKAPAPHASPKEFVALGGSACLTISAAARFADRA